MSIEAERLLKKIFGDESSDSDASPPRRTINTEQLFPLREIWPDVVAQLRILLTDAGEPELAATVETLEVFDRCRCGADFCGTVYTQPGRKIRETCKSPTAPHTTILDVVNDQIMCIETLDDHESRRRLIAALPDHGTSP